MCQSIEFLLKDNSNVKYPIVLTSSKSDYHLFTIWVDPKIRDSVMHFMQSLGVGVTVNYRSINKLTALDKQNYPHKSLDISEIIGDSTISLPLYPSLSKEDVEYVVETLLQALEQV